MNGLLKLKFDSSVNRVTTLLLHKNNLGSSLVGRSYPTDPLVSNRTCSLYCVTKACQYYRALLQLVDLFMILTTKIRKKVIIFFNLSWYDDICCYPISKYKLPKMGFANNCDACIEGLWSFMLLQRLIM